MKTSAAASSAAAAAAAAAVALQKAAVIAARKKTNKRTASSTGTHVATTAEATTTTAPPLSPLLPKTCPEEEEENSHQAIINVITALQQAIRRPLYVDLALQQDSCQSPVSKGAAAAAAVAAVAAAAGVTAVTETAGSKKRNNKTAADQKQRVATTSSSAGGPVVPAVPVVPVPSLSWTELLARAARLLVHCTPKEHGEILRLAAIVLLGHLLPHSTGHDYHLLQNAPRRNNQMNNNLFLLEKEAHDRSGGGGNVMTDNSQQDQNLSGGSGHHHYHHHHHHPYPFLASSSSSAAAASSSSSFDMHNYILNMSLQERLTCAAQWHDAVQNATEMDYAIQPCPRQQVALTKFLQDAIRPLLLARPVHEYQVDLLHLLAMMIQPRQPSLDDDNDGNEEDENDKKITTQSQEQQQYDDVHHPAWIYALGLAKSRSAMHFHVTNGHRVQAVQLIQLVVLPNGSSIDDDDDAAATNNMMYLQCGILRHLQACLSSFGQHVAHLTDAHYLANQKALVMLAAQQVPLQRQEQKWDFLLHEMVGDTIDYHAAAVTTLTTPATTTTVTPATSSIVAATDDKMMLTIDYDCCPNKKTKQKHYNNDDDDNANECPHVLRGKVLALFLNQSFLRQSGSISGGIGSGLPALHGHMLSSLADAIEWQMDAWIRVDNNKKKQKRPPAVCLLASLLFAAKHAFPLASTMSNDDDDDDDDDDEDDTHGQNNHGEHGQFCETLLESAICLLRHSAFYIRAEATDLLVRAFSHRNDASRSSNPKKYARSLLEAMKFTLLKNENNKVAGATTVAKGSANDNDENKSKDESRHFLVPAGTERLVGIVSRASPAFAIHLTKFIMEKQYTGSLAGRFLAVITLNCPTVAHKQVDTLLDALLDPREASEGAKSNEGSLSIIASILSARQARYFSNSRDGSNDGMSALHTALSRSLTKNGNRWDYYRMACHALRMGDYIFAATVFRKQLLSTSLNEKHYLWISVLEKVSTAEQILSKRAAKGIPSASNMLHAAVSYLQSLRVRAGQPEQILVSLPGDNNIEKTPTEGYEFQISFLLLRLDLLDLMTVLRQLAREMRLTGCGPAKSTRNFQHLKNTIHCFEALSARFAQLNQQYGMAFSSHSSTTCLVALQQVAMFLSQASRAVFADSLPPSSTKGGSSPQRGAVLSTDKSIKINKTNLPVLQLIQELDELVVRPMMDASSSSSSSTAIDPLVRSAAMLELLDGLLMVPYPYPRDFYTPRPRLYSELRLSADATEMMEYGSKTWNVIESYPSLCFTLQVAGRISPLLLRDQARCHRPVVMALLWLRIVYVGPLLQSDDGDAGGTAANGAAGDGDGGGGGGGGGGAVVDAAAEQQVEEETTTAAGVATSRQQQEEAIRQGLAKLPLASPMSMRLFPNNTGQFQAAVELPPLFSEGRYSIEVKLGCRDCVGAEWELAVTKNSHRSILIRNSRSR